MYENELQAEIRNGRSLSDGSMTDIERLSYANAASTPEEIAAKQAARAAVAEQLTREQREYLGDRAPEELTSKDDIDNFEFLGSEIFRKQRPEEDTRPSPSGGPLALDNERLGASGLSPEQKIDVVEAFATLERSAKEAGLNSAVRTVRPSKIESARLLVKPFLKK